MEIKKSLESRLNIKALNKESLNSNVNIQNDKSPKESDLLDIDKKSNFYINKTNYSFTAMEWLATWRAIE